MRTISVIILSADFFSSTFMTPSTQKENDRTTARRSSQDRRCLDALFSAIFAWWVDSKMNMEVLSSSQSTGPEDESPSSRQFQVNTY